MNRNKIALAALYGTGLLVTLIGSLVIIGWYSHTLFLIQMTPNTAPMQPNTGFAFVCCGLALLTFCKLPRLSLMFSLCIFLIGTMTLCEYIFSISLGIDQLLVKPFIITNSYPGRAAPNTALFITVLGLALLIRPTPTIPARRIHLFIFALCGFLIVEGATVIVGYLTHSSITYNWGNWSQIGPHTAITFMVVGLGLALFFWHHYNLQSINRNILFPIGVVIFGVLTFLLLWQLLLQNEHKKIVAYTQTQAHVIGSSLIERLEDYLLSLTWVKKQLIRDPQLLANWGPSAQGYLHDLPALAALALIPQTNSSTSLNAEVDPTIIQDATQPLTLCLQNSTADEITVVSYQEKHYLCLKTSIESNSKPLWLLSLINTEKLTEEIANIIPEINNFSFIITDQTAVLYQHVGQAISDLDQKWQSSIPILYKNLKLTIKIWPNNAIIKKFDTNFPIASLTSGLLVTLLIALVLRMWQLSKITERKSSDLALQCKTVLDATSNAILIVDTNGKIIEFNQTALQLSGYSAQEMQEITFESLIPKHLREKNQYYNNIYRQEITAETMGANKNLSLDTKTGEKIPVEMLLSPITLNHQQLMLCSIHDMRAAKITENKLIEQTQSMQVMINITHVVAREQNLETALRHCLSIICTSFSWPIGHVYLINENSAEPDELIPAPIWFLKEPERLESFRQVTMNTKLRYGIGLPGKVLFTGEATWIENPSADSNSPRAAAFRDSGIQTGFAFPIKINNVIVAVLEFFSHSLQEKDSNLLLAINFLSSQISHFAEYHNIQNKNKQLATRYEFALNAGKIGVWEYNFKTKHLIWNEQMFEIYGVPRALFTHHYSDWEQCVHPDDREKAARELQLAIEQSQVFDYEFRIIKSNGAICYIKAKAKTLLEEGNIPKIILGLNWDVTKEKELTNELEKTNHQLKHYAYYDALTGLMNRHAFDDAATRALAQAKRYQYLVGALFIDLDYFKQINESFGHPMGDLVLTAIAKKMSATMRSEDILCRLGGDEFFALINHISTQQDVITIAKQLIDEIQKPFIIEDHTIHIGVSIGIAFYPDMGNNLEKLIEHSDIALRKAKLTGKSHYEVYSAA